MKKKATPKPEPELSPQVTELSRLYRPDSLDEVIGQEGAVTTVSNWLKKRTLPHTILFTGPSGVGKTTLARIIRQELKCGDPDFHEVNCADSRGIDAMRDIRSWMPLAPLAGPVRVWLLDEAHKLTNDAQSSMLKPLEEPPPHVYFILCSTDPQKLLRTIITRCATVVLQAVSEGKLIQLVDWILSNEGATLPGAVKEEMVRAADGSPRQVIQFLGSVIDLETEKDQLAAIERITSKNQAIALARALLRGATWKEMATLLREVTEEPEGIRQMVLSYMASVLLGGGKDQVRAFDVIDLFRDHWFDSRRGGMVATFFEASNVIRDKSKRR